MFLAFNCFEGGYAAQSLRTDYAVGDCAVAVKDAWGGVVRLERLNQMTQCMKLYSTMHDR